MDVIMGQLVLGINPTIQAPKLSSSYFLSLNLASHLSQNNVVNLQNKSNKVLNLWLGKNYKRIIINNHYKLNKHSKKISFPYQYYWFKLLGLNEIILKLFDMLVSITLG